MIEKKIRYDINIEKPSKTKPVTQGGVLNYLGKQKTVTAPRRWRSSPDHPIAHLAYITKDEEKILIDLNLYGSLKGKPNKGPSGIMSLQGSGGGAGGGDGGGDGGDSGGSSDSDSGTGQSGAQSGNNSDGNNADGTSGGPGTDGMGGPGGFGGDVGAEGGFGIGPGDDGFGLGQADTFGSDVGPGLGIGENLGQADTFASDVNEDETTQQGFSFAPVTSLIESAIKGYMNFSPTGLAIKGITGLVDSVTKGKTGPSDDTQETFSVQVGPSPTNDPGGGITTIPTYASLTNVSTGDNTADAMRTRLENLLKGPPIAKIPTGEFTQVNNLQNISPLSNYTLLDLYNLRR